MKVVRCVIKEINVRGTVIKYTLTYKNVKNINLRIKPDGSVCVSANKRVADKIIESFILSKSDFILRALEKYKNMAEPKQYFEDSEIRGVIESVCLKVYPYYEEKGIKYPQIKFGKMKSRWGSCHTTEGILKFNTELKYAPYECIEYVVHHEFTHFLEPNHSKSFYAELEKVCPDYKIYRKQLKEINIR